MRRPDDEFGVDAFPGLHGPPGNKDRGDIQLQRRVEHPRRDLVTVRHAHQRIGGMRLHHILHRVGDDFAAGQGIQHSAVPHRNPVIHCNSVEFSGNPTRGPHRRRHHAADLVQMNVTGHKLGKRIRDRHNGFTEIGICHPGGTPQRPRPSHVSSRSGSCAAQTASHGETFFLSRGYPSSLGLMFRILRFRLRIRNGGGFAEAEPL